jgi:glycosyltransferase involved in cell wall biosynthesis
LLGQRPHAELARYIRGFDVGIVPYKLSEYTANVYPTKLNEYLVMGIPVVATDLPEIRRFNRDHGEIVNVASGADTFAAATADASRGSTAGEIARRIEVAHSNSWPTRIASMRRSIDEGVARRAATEQRIARRAYHRTRGR